MNSNITGEKKRRHLALHRPRGFGEDSADSSGDAAKERQMVVDAEEWRLRGICAKMGAFYDSFPKDSPYFHLAARVAAMAAVNIGDVALFDRVRRDIRAFHASGVDADLLMATELVELLIRVRLRLKDGYPKWLEQFDFAEVPLELHPFAFFLSACLAYVQGRLAEARTAAGMALAVNRCHDQIGYADMWLAMTQSAICRDQQLPEEERRWFKAAAAVACKRQFVVPFLEYSMWVDQSPAERLSMLGIRQFVDLDRQAEEYFQATVKMRNHLTGERITDKLTRRQFFIASYLKAGYSYKEIASLMGVSVGRVRNLVITIYSKLNIHSSDELQDLVW